MTAVVDLITDAAYAARILGQDQTLASADAQLMLRRLNRMLDSWANEKLIVFANTNQTFTMVPSQGQYSTSLFTDGRPVAINSMVVSLSNIDYPVTMIDVNRWNSITYKLTESIPNNCYYNPTFPDGELNFYTLPYAAFTCTVDCQYPLTGVLVLGTDVTLPPGYEKAIVDNLALDICSSFGVEAANKMVKDATESKGWIKRNNYMPMEMATFLDYDPANISNAFLYKGF